MKKNIIITLLAAAFLSCERDQLVEKPNLTIQVVNSREVIGDTIIFNLGDTSRFAISNSADNIIFYSGEAGHNYENRTRTRANGKPVLNFTTRMLYGTQNASLKLLATNRLPGLDSASIVDFDGWTDISDRAQWATVNSTNTGSTTVNAVNSGDIDLSDILQSQDDSLVIAFKFNGFNGTTQKTWFITNYFLYNTLDGVQSTVSSLSTDVSLWKNIKVGTSSANWQVTTSQLRIDGGGAAAPDNENWLVSKPIFISRVNPDTPAEILKYFNSPQVASYDYVFSKPGVYNATFVASNVTADDQKELLVQYIIKVRELVSPGE